MCIRDRVGSKSTILDDSFPRQAMIIKCLEGFPILLFMHIVTEDPDTGLKDDVYYYFGVYNFNLGRDVYKRQYMYHFICGME